MDVIGQGHTDHNLSDDELRRIVASAASRIDPSGKRILAIIPDQTRCCPLPATLRRLHEVISPQAKCLDFLIALGTHPPMSEEQIDKLVGVEPGRRAKVFGKSRFFNHEWKNLDALTKIGTLAADHIDEITGGLFAMDIDVTINKRILEYDVVLVVGPVFPHEVVGFSGGSKYFFPGVSGPELLNFFHWLGAVITNPKIIGSKHTPVRKTLEAAADMLRVETFAFCMVVAGEGRLAGMYFGPVSRAWSAAADLSDRIHINYVEKPFASVLSCAPQMYEDLWTGGKCMYKLECVVADGGELIIYAPHISEVSITHGKVIEAVGYHTRDYFMAQWDKFRHYPWGVLAHSTQVRGIGAYVDGVERPRIQVTLATAIPARLCRKINLGYRDPASIDVAEWQNRQAESRLHVPNAGERLYKLKNPPDWQRFK
ncbi:MAG: lactate racemase domain-containing protein [Planctomycetota bacterium]|nr:lactate racemase domain-containing protein [Planctomycetota bacterium]